MLKWIKNKFIDDTPKVASYEEEIIQETTAHRDSTEIQNEQNEQGEQQNLCFSLILDETSQSAVQDQVDIRLEVSNESNNLEQLKQNYQREYSSLFLLEEVKKEVKEEPMKPKPKPKQTIKKPFKPTRVPSPIYGFKPRPGVEKKEEQPVGVAKEVNKPVAELIGKAEEVAKEAQENLTTEFSDGEKQEEQPKNKKRVVPYNVMMRQKDRRKMTRVREQREK